MDKSRILKEFLVSEETLVMPDAYDSISAKLIEENGFKAVQCSGYSFSIQAGYRKEINVTLNDNIEWTRRIVESVNIPVMADAEDGYGDSETVIETVKKFMDIGVAGLNLEDQIPDDENTVNIVDSDLMIDKIMVARETSEMGENPDFIINGRTDALRTIENRSEGLKLAINRANKYLNAGADITFIPYVQTMDEVKRIMKQVKGPVSIAAGMPYNIREFSVNDLRQYGVARVSLPSLLIYSGLQAMNRTLEHVKDDDFNAIIDDELLYSPDKLRYLLK